MVNVAHPRQSSVYMFCLGTKMLTEGIKTITMSRTSVRDSLCAMTKHGSPTIVCFKKVLIVYYRDISSFNVV